MTDTNTSTTTTTSTTSSTPSTIASNSSNANVLSTMPFISAKDRFAPFIEEILELPAFFLAKPLDYVAAGDLCSVEGQVAGVTGGDPFAIPSNKFKRKVTTFTLQVNTKSGRQFNIAEMPFIMYNTFESVEIHGTKTNERKFKSFNDAVHQDLKACYYRLKPHAPLASLSPDLITFQQFRALCHHIFRFPEGKQTALDYPIVSRIFKTVVAPSIASAGLTADKAKQELLCKTSFTTYDQVGVPPIAIRNLPISKEAVLKWAAGESTMIKDKLLRNYHLKMLFYTAEWNLVSRYYHHDVLGDALPLTSFLELYRILCEQPISMCFQQRIQIRYEVPTKIDEHDNEVVIHRRLPELSMQHFMDVHAQLAVEKKIATSVSLDDLVLLTIYQALKNARDKDKHAYVTRKDLRLDARAICMKNLSLPREVLQAMERSEGDQWWTALLKRMSDDKIIKYDPSSAYPYIYLYECWTWEEVITHNILHLAQQQKRFAQNESTMYDEPSPNSVNDNVAPVETLVSCINSAINDDTLTTLKSQRGHLLCSEQQAGLRSVIKNPVTVINGPAGSGKTDFLQSIRAVLRPRMITWYEEKGDKSIAHHYDASGDCIIATSMQGNNASDLNKVFVGSGSSTTHRLILQHHLHCPTYGFEYIASLKNTGVAPSTTSTTTTTTTTTSTTKGVSLATTLSSSDASTKSIQPATPPTKKCIFEDIRILVIEEGSLYNPELMCKLGGIISLCAKGFEKLVVVGDHKQLASTSGGNYLKDMTSAFDVLGTSVHFTHDHRTSKESALLKNNNTAILASSPEYVKFDGKIAVHVPIQPQGVWDMTLTEVELRTIIIQIVKHYELTIYNSHCMTRVNKNRNLIEDTLRRHYFGKYHPTEDYARYAYGYPSEFKIVFSQNDYTGSIVSNRIYIIVGIIDLDFVEPTTANAANMKRYVHISSASGGGAAPANCSLVRSVEQVWHTNNAQNYSRVKRYLVLYELSAFATPLKLDAGQTYEDALRREFARFLRDLRYPTTKATENMVYGEKHSPMIHDDQKVFTVIMWTPEVRNNSSSAFCTTINKFQGSQLPKIVGFLLSDSPYDTQESMYTLYTRAQEQLISVHNEMNFAAAIMRKEPKRNSTLANKILEHADELGDKEKRERERQLAKQKKREVKEKRRAIRRAEKNASKKQKKSKSRHESKEEEEEEEE